MDIREILSALWDALSFLLYFAATYLYSQFRATQAQVRTLENSVYRLENRVESQNTLIIEKLTNIEKFFTLRMERLDEKISDLNERFKNETSKP